jgi:UDP-glucose 4-epimerase
VLELAETLGRAARRTPRIAFGPARPGDIRHSLGDGTAAAALLGVRAATRLEDGLAATLQWLRDTQEPANSDAVPAMEVRGAA